MKRAFTWISLAARLGLGVVFIAASVPKFNAPSATTMGFEAYELFGYDVAHTLAIVVPSVEIGLGVVLIVGLLTRYASIFAAVLLCVYVALIVSAWARGLSIDCGCFSTGGTVVAHSTRYGTDIMRDVAFIVMAVLSAIGAPRHRLSLDAALDLNRKDTDAT